MKYLFIFATFLASCTGNGIEVSNLDCFDCVAYDMEGNLLTVDTVHVQRFWMDDWCRALAEWDQVCDCWRVRCNQ